MPRRVHGHGDSVVDRPMDRPLARLTPAEAAAASTLGLSEVWDDKLAAFHDDHWRIPGVCMNDVEFARFLAMVKRMAKHPLTGVQVPCTQTRCHGARRALPGSNAIASSTHASADSRAASRPRAAPHTQPRRCDLCSARFQRRTSKPRGIHGRSIPTTCVRPTCGGLMPLVREMVAFQKPPPEMLGFI